MDHWQLFTFSVLGFNFLAVAVIGAILVRAARRDDPRKPKRVTGTRLPKLTTAEAQSIVKGEMHPLTAWRLGADLSRKRLGKISKVGTGALRAHETRETKMDQATQQAVISAMLTSWVGTSIASYGTPPLGTSESASIGAASDGGGGGGAAV